MNAATSDSGTPIESASYRDSNSARSLGGEAFAGNLLRPQPAIPTRAARANATSGARNIVSPLHYLVDSPSEPRRFRINITTMAAIRATTAPARAIHMNGVGDRLSATRA